MRLRDRQNGYEDLYSELIMVDNSDNYFKSFAPITTSQVLNTLTQSMRCKGESPELCRNA